MNERIKQLALQALKHPDTDNDGLTVFDNDELKKFAELIAYECIDLALGSSHRDDDMGAIIANKIKKHFGVEE
jgi:hypothetical protein